MEKRQSGGDNFKVKVVSEDGNTEGSARIVDKNNGTYDVFYRVPMPGVYLVHVSHMDLGERPEELPTRGSPFKVTCQDPWTRQRVMGSTPTNKKGTQLATIGNELIVYKASEAGVSTCNTEGQDWKWSTVEVSGTAPPTNGEIMSKSAQNGRMVMGSMNLCTNDENKDMYNMVYKDNGFEWEETEKPLHFWELQLLDTPFRKISDAADLKFDSELPPERKGAAVATTMGRLFVFSGKCLNEDDETVYLEDMVILGVEPESTVSVKIETKPEDSEMWPCPRTGAVFEEFEPGVLFLYGGVASDGTPLNDAYTLDVNQMAWKLVYHGDSSLVLPTGPVATIKDKKLVMLNAAAGSPKLDVAMTLDIFGMRESFAFLPKMKEEAQALLDALESWVVQQEKGLELASNPDMLAQKFESLLKVMDALYQVTKGLNRIHVVITATDFVVVHIPLKSARILSESYRIENRIAFK